jgi:hypothetical protein
MKHHTTSRLRSGGQSISSSDESERTSLERGHSSRDLKASLCKKLLGHDGAALSILEGHLHKQDRHGKGSMDRRSFEECLLKKARAGTCPSRDEVLWLIEHLKSKRNEDVINYSRIREVLSGIPAESPVRTSSSRRHRSKHHESQCSDDSPRARITTSRHSPGAQHECMHISTALVCASWVCAPATSSCCGSSVLHVMCM